MTIVGTSIDAIFNGAAKLGGQLSMAALVAGSLLIGTEASAKDGAFIQTIAASPPPSGARQLCRQYSWACAQKGAASLSNTQEMQLVKQINRQVNASTRAVTDQSQYKTRELWALPTSMGGDCEDFALLKKRDLIRAGIDPRKLLIATVLDTRRNSHAVLVYRSSQGDLVLDNLTNSIKPWSATRYLFLRMQDPKQPRKWVGIYGRS
ncbi:Predicted transglutaminase-like cysteine proteinase [Ruegeria halocynthiae]|uniref:Predicted transglutaminase-like cysteine proteinase n=1 Tax=Ruegeria halocynthiae TaxID=985054 RepID=A0A1H2T796_9RHOB|nr:transglutaminase-like cysteine peptidase [Ruegeria halocynthiae]SDW39826.1 Predicted transglutaminase-like cysteine proteinase [Ruegeria halocynthiae]